MAPPARGVCGTVRASEFPLSEIRLGANAGARAVAANADDAAAAGGVRQHPGSTTALRGLMASLALTGASPWRAMSMRDRPAGCASCATPPVRRSVRQRAAAARRPTSIVCWWRTGDAGGAEDRRRAAAGVRRRRRATARQRATNTTLAATRRHPRGSVSDQHDTRRHTATSMLMIAAAAAGRAARFSYGVLAKAWC